MREKLDTTILLLRTNEPNFDAIDQFGEILFYSLENGYYPEGVVEIFYDSPDCLRCVTSLFEAVVGKKINRIVMYDIKYLTGETKTILAPVLSVAAQSGIVIESVKDGDVTSTDWAKDVSDESIALVRSRMWEDAQDTNANKTFKDVTQKDVDIAVKKMKSNNGSNGTCNNGYLIVFRPQFRTNDISLLNEILHSMKSVYSNDGINITNHIFLFGDINVLLSLEEIAEELSVNDYSDCVIADMSNYDLTKGNLGYPEEIIHKDDNDSDDFADYVIMKLLSKVKLKD